MTNKDIKLMVLGVAIMLAGIYIHIEPGLSQNLYGYEFYIVLIGFLVSLVGFLRKIRNSNNKNKQKASV